MKTRASYILIVIGCFGLMGQLFFQIQTEKSLLESQFQVQRAALVEGIKANWKRYLLEQARSGALKPDFQLKWNRKGTRLRGQFFPFGPAQSDWAAYRKLVERQQGSFKKPIDNSEKKSKYNSPTDPLKTSVSNSVSKSVSDSDLDSSIRHFLLQALQRINSWDRILAIEEWQEHYGQAPKTNTEYENTLVDPEAKTAYRMIFEQFSSPHDYTFLSSKVEYDRVFIHVSDSGEILAFVPRLQQIKETILPNFLTANGLPSADLGETPWDIALPEKLRQIAQVSYLSFLVQLGCFFSLGLGVIVYFLGLQDQRKILSNRVSFLNQVVHELKTPLAGLKLHLQLYTRGQPENRNLLAVDQSLDRLNRIFDDVLLMNRPNQRLTPDLLSVATLNQVLEDIQSEFNTLEISGRFRYACYGEEKRLRIIIRNLVKNGFRYGIQAHLDIKSDTDETTLFIRDQGPGIPRSESHKIFHEFYRSEVAQKTEADGLGLGLFIVKKLSEEMDSQVELTNPGQAGAIFSLKLKIGS